MTDDKSVTFIDHHFGSLSDNKLCDLIIESVSDMVGIEDMEHRLLYISPSVESLLGYTPEEVAGQNGRDYAHPDDLPAIRKGAAELLAKRETVFEYRARHKNGNYIWMENKLRVVFNEQTGEDNIIFVVRDISHRKEMETRLKLNENRFLQYINNPLVGVALRRADRTTISVNSVLCDILGYSNVELMTLPYVDYVHPVDYGSLLPALKHMYATGTAFYRPATRFIHKDKSIIYADLSVQAILDMDGKVESTITVLDDVTDRVNAYNEISEVHRQLHNLLGNLSGMAYRGNNDSCWTMLFLSNGCLDLTGYMPDEIIKDRLADYEQITHPEDRVWVRKHINEAIRGHKPYQMTYRIVTKFGETKWVWEQGNAVYENNELKFLEGFITDVTAAKTAEDALAKAAQEMQNLNKMKDKFFSIIAHDLKNPIYAIISLADLMRTHLSQFDTTKQLEIANDILEAAQSSYMLLDNLLEWSKTQTGNLECQCERINIAKLIAECVKLVRGQAETKEIGIHVKIAETLFAEADNRMLSTAVRNLLSNAIKFTHKGGTVSVYAEETEAYIKIHLQDNGIGLSREQRENIFRIDKRSIKNGTENEPGSGLGLILSRELIEKHRGTITVASKLGQGSTFTICLPRVSDTAVKSGIE